MLNRRFTTQQLFYAVCVLLLGLLVTARDSAAQTPVDPRFGAVESFWVPEDAAELGIGWERILFYWREIQPAGPEDWNTLHVREEWLREAEAQGQTVVGLLKNTPSWATDDASEAGLPRGLYLPLDDPDNLWANFVRRIATYYSERGVHHWIIWNEPEIEPGVFGHEFAGSEEDYARLLQVAYLVMKEADPDAVVHLAGLTWWHDPTYLGRLLGAIDALPDAAANNHYFDTLSLHIYFQTNTVDTIVREVDAIQNEFGLDKPIWINETNASPNLDPDWPVERPRFQVDLEQQAWFIVQAHALSFGAGASHVGVYKLLDINIPPAGESFGILRPDKSRRPAFFALQATIEHLSGFSAVGDWSTETVRQVVFNRPVGTTHIIWNPTTAEQMVTLSANAQQAMLYNAVGESLGVVDATDGVYRLTLPAARCYEECVVEGAPFFLLEADVQADGLLPVDVPLQLQPTVTPSATPTATAIPPTATATSLPMASATATLLPSPEPSATPLPAATATPEPAPSASERQLSDTIGLWLLAAAGVVGAVVAILFVRQRG